MYNERGRGRERGGVEEDTDVSSLENCRGMTLVKQASGRMSSRRRVEAVIVTLYRLPSAQVL
jgi:hypothetical protein